MAHWKHTATRCAVEGCENTRKRGWTTCLYYGHYEQGVSLYGLAPKAPHLKPARQENAGGSRADDLTSTRSTPCSKAALCAIASQSS